jgi:hypothetical protein
LRFTKVPTDRKAKGNEILEFESHSHPIAFSQVELWLRNLDTGVDKLVRSTENVGPRMALRWVTRNYPDGVYALSLVGKVEGQPPIHGPSVNVEVKNE